MGFSYKGGIIGINSLPLLIRLCLMQNNFWNVSLIEKTSNQAYTMKACLELNELSTASSC